LLDAALTDHSLEVALQPGDAFPNAAAVDFELRLAGAARADPAPESPEVLPHPREPREQVLELGQLHLEPRLARARPLGEDVEDQRGPVDDPHLQLLLEIPVLGRREIVVEEQEPGALFARQAVNLFDLPLAEERGGADRPAALQHFPPDRGARRLGEEPELGEGDGLVAVVAAVAAARAPATGAPGASGQDRALGIPRRARGVGQANVAGDRVGFVAMTRARFRGRTGCP
jgi:hypothetical protein